MTDLNLGSQSPNCRCHVTYPGTIITPFSEDNTTVQHYGTTIQPYSTTLQYNTTIQHYSTTLRYDTTIQPYSTTLRYNPTVQPYSTTVRYNTTIQPYSSTLQYNTIVQHYSTTSFSNLKAECDTNYICTPSSHRAVNILHLHYKKKQSVISVENNHIL
jgi:hypothetical protein